MNGEKPSVLDPDNKKIDFKYSFEISGFKKKSGKGSIAIHDHLSDEDIKNLINNYVLQRVREFLSGKTIQPQGNFTINTWIEITKTNVVKPWNNILHLGQESGQVTSRKYIVIMVGVAFVLLMFFLVFLNHSSLAPVE